MTNYLVTIRFHDDCEVCQQCVDRAEAILNDNPEGGWATVSINTFDRKRHSATVEVTES